MLCGGMLQKAECCGSRWEGQTRWTSRWPLRRRMLQSGWQRPSCVQRLRSGSGELRSILQGLWAAVR